MNIKKIYTKEIKKDARELRLQGWSYKKIGNKIRVPKSTLSTWLKDTPLPLKFKERLYTKQIKMMTKGEFSQKDRRNKEITSIIKKAKSEIKKPIGLDAYRFFGAALYWAEGSKNKMFQMTNSDPYLVLFWIKWVEKIFKITPHKLTVRLNIYPQQSEKNIKKFWSDLTKIPVANFGKSYVKPLSTNYKKNNLYYGTLRIEVPKGTDYRHRVYGWTQAILKDIAPQVKLIEKRWQKLKNVAKPINLN